MKAPKLYLQNPVKVKQSQEDRTLVIVRKSDLHSFRLLNWVEEYRKCSNPGLERLYSIMEQQSS